MSLSTASSEKVTQWWRMSSTNARQGMGGGMSLGRGGGCACDEGVERGACTSALPPRLPPQLLTATLVENLGNSLDYKHIQLFHWFHTWPHFITCTWYCYFLYPCLPTVILVAHAYQKLLVWYGINQPERPTESCIHNSRFWKYIIFVVL